MKTLHSIAIRLYRFKSCAYLATLLLVFCMSSSALFGQAKKFDQKNLLPQKLELAKSMAAGSQLQLSSNEIQYIDENLKSISVEIESVKKNLKKAKLYKDTAQVSILKDRLEILRKMVKDFDYVKIKSIKAL